jgi:hypothetical protein
MIRPASAEPGRLGKTAIDRILGELKRCDAQAEESAAARMGLVQAQAAQRGPAAEHRLDESPARRYGHGPSSPGHLLLRFFVRLWKMSLP